MNNNGRKKTQVHPAVLESEQSNRNGEVQVTSIIKHDEEAHDHQTTLQINEPHNFQMQGKHISRPSQVSIMRPSIVQNANNSEPQTQALTNQQLVTTYPALPTNSNSSSITPEGSAISHVHDKFMIYIFVICLIAFIALGLYSIKISNPFYEIKLRYNENEKVVVQGFFSVLIAFCITFILGLLMKLSLKRNFKLTIKLSIVLSSLILIALVAYSFYLKEYALGIVSSIVAFLILIIGFSYFEQINAFASVGEMLKYFDMYQARYFYLLTSITIIVLISIAFTIVSVIHILFLADNNPSSQNAINFFAAIFVFLSYWVNNTIITFYSYIISRSVSQVFFQKEPEIKHVDNIIAKDMQNTNIISIRGNEQKASNDPYHQPSLNSGDSDNMRIIDINVQPQSQNVPSNPETISNIQQQGAQDNKNLLMDQRKILNTPPPKENLGNISRATQGDNRIREESTKQSLRACFRQFGSISYCSLVSQITECLVVALMFLVYGTGIVLIYSRSMLIVREMIIKINGYLSIIRMANEQVDYCTSLRLVSKQIVKKNYLFALGLHVTNQISQTIEFFCFITGFAVGIILLVMIDYSYWFLTFIYVLLSFCIVKTASKLTVVSQTTILFSVCTYFDLMAVNDRKNPKFLQIYLMLKQARKFLAEGEEQEKDIEELY